MTHPPPPPPPPPTPHPPPWQPAPPRRPVPAGRVLLAGFLDQVVLVAVFLLLLGTGLLLDDLDVAVSLGPFVLGAILAPLLLMAAEIVLLVRTGSSAGSFLVGARMARGAPVHWHDDAGDWFVSFWPNLVLLPFARIVGGARRVAEGPAWVDDPRARTAPGRIARLLLAGAMLTGPAVVAAALTG